MKPSASLILWVAALFLCLWRPTLWAEDMRKIQIETRMSKETLMEKAAAEKAQAERETAENRKRIAEDRKALEKAVSELSVTHEGKAREVAALKNRLSVLAEQEPRIDQELGRTDAMMSELVGVIRVNAKDVAALIDQDPRSALLSPVNGVLSEVAEQTRFPDMTDARRMADILEERVRTSGEVTRQPGTIVDRSGKRTEAEILLLGPFTAAYRSATEVGFLNHVSADQRLYALSRLPSGRMQKEIGRYMDGTADAVPMDISRGAALRQLTHELNLFEQIPTGGPIVWPILAIFVIGVLIVLERALFLLRRRFNADGLMANIHQAAMMGQWDRCGHACGAHIEKPVARVVSAGLACRHMQREEMENALQEAILREIPSMERFLSTLGMLATIAPLLGLLGTVTGMIHVFHVITLHGTGDPRLMSGGISEALVTTMLGLAVAIPLMLAQTLLNRSVDRSIGQMEEKAVALVNIVHKSRGTA